MEIYLIVPDDLKKTHALYEICRDIFSRQRDKVFLYSNFNEKCVSVALEIAKNIGCSFAVDQHLNSEAASVNKFPRKHYWPNHFIQILVVQGHIAHAVAKMFNPEVIKDKIPAVPTDVLFRLKDIFPGEVSEVDDQNPGYVRENQDNPC